MKQVIKSLVNPDIGFFISANKAEVKIMYCKRFLKPILAEFDDKAVKETTREAENNKQLSMFIDNCEKNEYYEQTGDGLIFNVPMGSTFAFQVFSGDQKLRNITNNSKHSIIASEIPENRPLVNKLIRLLSNRIGCVFPITAGRERLEHLILYNRFKEFPESFYMGIPFDLAGERIINQSFSLISEKIAFSGNAVDAYDALGFPRKKALRSIIFNNPALLFYIEEIRALPFKNYDVVIAILRSDVALAFLSELHGTPAIYRLLSTIIMVKGEVQAWKKIKNDIFLLRKLAAYWSLANSQVKTNPKLYNGDINSIIDTFEGLGLAESRANLPITYSPKELLLEETVNGYSFVLPHNTYDLFSAATVLNNCLSIYWTEVIRKKVMILLIMKKHRTVGAIELDDTYIKQAYLRDNEIIKENTSVYNSLKRWAEKHSLKIALDDPFDPFDGFADIGNDDGTMFANIANDDMPF